MRNFNTLVNINELDVHDGKSEAVAIQCLQHAGTQIQHAGTQSASVSSGWSSTEVEPVPEQLGPHSVQRQADLVV